jgi:hypothetical protein
MFQTTNQIPLHVFHLFPVPGLLSRGAQNAFAAPDKQMQWGPVALWRSRVKLRSWIEMPTCPHQQWLLITLW